MNREEHQMQTAFMNWVSLVMKHERKDLRLMFAIPNGGARDARTGAMLKMEGVRKGVPDLCLPVRRGEYLGLWIEMKAPGRKPTPEQYEWHDWLTLAGHVVAVCYSRDDAQRVTEAYLDSKIDQLEFNNQSNAEAL